MPDSTMSSATSTERSAARPAPAAEPAPFRAWHFFILLAMLGATVAVVLARHTHPVALLLLTAAVVCAGFVGIAVHTAVSGFFTRGQVPEPLPPSVRDELLREKALVLRSIKELEFDHRMGKVSETDFAEISGRLRARALALMADLERTEASALASDAGPAPASTAERATEAPVCPSCQTPNDTDARFCKQCGAILAAAGSAS